MRRTGCLLIGLVVVVAGCTADTPEPEQDPVNKLFDYAAERLPDRLMEETAPSGFRVLRVPRHSLDSSGRLWVTVGAQMDGPVDFTRAIFYVHPDEDSAAALNSSQIEHTKRDYKTIRSRPFREFRGETPRPFEVSSDDQTAVCGVRGAGLIWCHAQEGRLYLLVQSSAGTFSGKSRVTDQQLDAAREVTAAYLELL